MPEVTNLFPVRLRMAVQAGVRRLRAGRPEFSEEMKILMTAQATLFQTRPLKLLFARGTLPKNGLRLLMAFQAIG
ncbi:MAG: hypothetical protein A2X94_12970 [Bdellovibrionales bacterium GWB1_55_8]|nr:MAG: hypothetical protein A2X94_12970 [Bdellovibrionales bacterium GWB1_55_8]